MSRNESSAFSTWEGLREDVAHVAKQTEERRTCSLWIADAFLLVSAGPVSIGGWGTDFVATASRLHGRDLQRLTTAQRRALIAVGWSNPTARRMIPGRAPLDGQVVATWACSRWGLSTGDAAAFADLVVWTAQRFAVASADRIHVQFDDPPVHVPSPAPRRVVRRSPPRVTEHMV